MEGFEGGIGDEIVLDVVVCHLGPPVGCAGCVRVGVAGADRCGPVDSRRLHFCSYAARALELSILYVSDVDVSAPLAEPDEGKIDVRHS